MKKHVWRLSLAALGGLMLLGTGTVVRAQDDRVGDRLERLERRVNELAEHQQQFIRRLEARAEREPLRPFGAQPGQPERRARQPAPLGPQTGAAGVPMPQPADQLQPLPAPGSPPQPAPLSPVANAIHKLGELIRLCLLVGLAFNILLAVWIYGDIRKRGEGSGIFVVLAVLAGVPAAIIYALVRLGDKKA